MLIVFDLDFTLWDCGGTWCDHTTPPYYRENGLILDDDGRAIRLYPDVRAILQKLRLSAVPVGIASRTHEPLWAEELMQLFEIGQYVDYFEIYPGSKVSHFKSLHSQTGIPYEQMVFFDDEYRNIDEVQKLGVTSVFVDNGLSYELVHPFFES